MNPQNPPKNQPLPPELDEEDYDESNEMFEDDEEEDDDGAQARCRS
jgi:hypothetical protein